MSKLSKAADKLKEVNSLRPEEIVTNYMGGDSYVINPLDTLKMVSASSIFAEPSYYRSSKSFRAYIYEVNPLVAKDSIIDHTYKGMTTDEIMEDVIDKALDYDFKGTLNWAITLRNEYNMRLNPQVIMVRAALHPKRKEFTENNPGEFDRINQEVMGRADEPMTQMAYYIYKNKGAKNKMPSLLKRSWAKNLSNLSRYKVAKYKNHEIGMINAVRLCHANSKVIDELMTTGTVEVSDNSKTWENLRSEGKSWKEIFETIKIGHMALLRNLRGIFTEVEDLEFCKKVMQQLKDGVKEGKQFPFRYYTAYKMIENNGSIHHRSLILNALEECMDIAIENMPKLDGKTMCLSDNSGSAWGTFNSEYGTVTVAEIANLSAVVTAMLSDEGYVGVFGDRLHVIPIIKRGGVLAQMQKVTQLGKTVGGSTENGIWLFWNKAIKDSEKWDNVFIYSDMQCSHAELYGIDSHEYADYVVNHNHINVLKLVNKYRCAVSAKINVFSIQVAGYTDVCIPEMTYRHSILYGWTGKESVYARANIDIWNNIEHKNVKTI